MSTAIAAGTLVAPDAGVFGSPPIAAGALLLGGSLAVGATGLGRLRAGWGLGVSAVLVLAVVRLLGGGLGDPVTFASVLAVCGGVVVLGLGRPDTRRSLVAAVLGLPALAAGGVGMALQIAGQDVGDHLLGLQPAAAAGLLVIGLAAIFVAWSHDPTRDTVPAWVPPIVTAVVLAAAFALWFAFKVAAAVPVAAPAPSQGLSETILLGGGVLAILAGAALHLARVARAQTVAARRELAERVRAERRLRESEAAAQALFDRAIQGIARISLDGVLCSCNPALCELSGYRAAELEGRHLLELVAPEDLDATAETFADVVNGGSARRSLELRLVRRDGRWLCVRGTVAMVSGDAGEPRFLVAMLEDVTERVSYARNLEQLNTRLAAQNSELERFASIVAHDLQEPLLTVRLFADHLDETQAERLDDEGRDFLGRIRRAGGRMQELIESLLALSHITSRAAPFTHVDLVSLVREVLGDLDRRLREACGEVIVGPLPVIQGDPAQLRQLFQNLLGNALKFHRPGVTPVVRIESRTDADGSGCALHTITVMDNGIGFEAGEVEKMFEPLRRLDGARSYEGTGMGLAICRKIVERHGGRLTALGRRGEGGTFLVTLPAVVADGPAVTEPSPARYSGSKRAVKCRSEGGSSTIR